MRMRRVLIRRRTTKVKVRHRSGLVRLKTSRGVVIALALLVVVSVPLVRDEEVDLLVALEARDRVMVAEVGPHFAVGVIVGILVSIGVAAVVVLLVGRWDIELRIVPRVSSRSRSRLSCRHLHRSSRFLALVVMGR